MALGNNGRRTIIVAAYLVVFHTLFAYGLPIGLFALLALGFGVLCYRTGPAGSVLLAATLLAATLLYGAMLRVTGLENAIYYRPDEMLSEYRADLGHRAYRRGTTLRMHMPYGDLQPMTKAAIGVARDVEYRIDNYGFRNDGDYAGEPYVLVGDSFIAGSSNTQADLLSSQLRHDYGIQAYNLAHPGDLTSYADYVDEFARTHGDFRVLLFIFEGNDFEGGPPEGESERRGFWKQYYNVFSGTNVYRVTKSLIKRTTRRAQIAGDAYVTVRELNGHPLAFLTRYIEATRVTHALAGDHFERALARLKPRLAHVFFIPTNYRVYYRALEGAQAPPLPNANWEYLQGLCVRTALACTNLTAPMMREADKMLARAEFVWWPDDTHWNRRGIAVAAQVVADTLRRDARVASGGHR